MLPAPSSADPENSFDKWPSAPSEALSIWRETGKTLVLAVPMMAGQVGQMLMGLVDSIMVGHLGVTPLAASAFANGLLSVPLLFGIGLTGAVSVLSAQAHGAGRPRDAAEVLRHGLIVALLGGLAMAGLTELWVFLGGLNRVGQPPEVVAGARSFFLIMNASVVSVLFWQVLKQFCEALSRPWMPLVITVGAVALNVRLNWVLIYGRFGVPALGLFGAGLGTFIARAAMVVGLAVFVLRVTSLRAALPRGWAEWIAPLSFERFRALLALGFPVALQLVLEVGAFGVATLMMGWLGERALAAHQIAINCAATTFMFPLGLGMAVSIRIGQAVGAKADRRVVRTIGFGGVGLAALMMGFSALGFLVWRRELATLFVADAAVVALTAQLLIVAGIFQIADGVQIVSMGALRGLADVKTPTLISLFCYWLVALPTCYVAGFTLRHGPQGVWAGLAVGLGCAAVFLTMRFRIKT
jgi:MATE family multidrug resistance protein